MLHEGEGIDAAGNTSSSSRPAACGNVTLRAEAPPRGQDSKRPPGRNRECNVPGSAKAREPTLLIALVSRLFLAERLADSAPDDLILTSTYPSCHVVRTPRPLLVTKTGCFAAESSAAAELPARRRPLVGESKGEDCELQGRECPAENEKSTGSVEAAGKQRGTITASYPEDVTPEPWPAPDPGSASRAAKLVAVALS